jgi:hypothetical protein
VGKAAAWAMSIGWLTTWQEEAASLRKVPIAPRQVVQRLRLQEQTRLIRLQEETPHVLAADDEH